MGSVLGSSYPEVRQSVVHNAVDLSEFTYRPYTANATPRIGMLANLVPVKGHEDFLRAAARLSQERPSLEFHLFGSDVQGTGYGDALARLATELGIARHVHFRGHVDDVDRALGELSVLAVPSHMEAFGRSVIEGMACGIPVVGPASAAFPKSSTTAETDSWSPRASRNNLSSAIGRILSDAAFAKRLSRTGRADVEARFGLDAHARQMYEVFQTVAGVKTRP